MSIELQPLGGIIQGFLDLDECPINESNTTLELEDLCTKNHSFLKVRQSNLIAKCWIDARCNENCIIAYNIFDPILKECVIHDNIVMFHV